MSEQKTAAGGHNAMAALSIEKILETAFAETDAMFTQHVAEHWNKLGDKKIQAEIARISDMPAARFSRWHLMNNLAHFRASLEKHMQDVRSDEDFADKCIEFIDEEMERLFFVTNNVTDARVAQDYFERFVVAATEGLRAAGKIDKDTAESYEALQEYYDIGFESYSDLRDLVQIESGGTTSSLVAYAMAQQLTDENKPALKKLLGLKDTDRHAEGMVSEISQRAYQQMMKSQPIFQNANEPFDYHGVWLYRGAMDIAQDEYQDEMPKYYDKREAVGRVRQHVKTHIGLINEAFALIREQGEVEGLIAARQLFDEKRLSLRDMPDSYDELLDHALLAAGNESCKHIAQTIANDRARRHELPVPASQRLGRMLWPHLEDARIMQGVAEELNEYWSDELSRCTTPKLIAQKADSLLDSLAMDVFYNTSNPALFLHATNYLGTLRRSLGGALHEEGKFRPEDFSALRRVEEKCLHYYESFLVTREWIMEDTAGAYDRLATQQYMNYAAENGRLYQDLEAQEWTHHLMPQAQQAFVQLLRNMNVYHAGCEHMLVPLLAAKARTIATKEMGEPDNTLNDDEKAEYYTKLWGRAREILSKSLHGLPQRDIDHGRKVKSQPFTAEHVADLMRGLDNQIKLAGCRGTVH